MTEEKERKINGGMSTPIEAAISSPLQHLHQDLGNHTVEITFEGSVGSNVPCKILDEPTSPLPPFIFLL